MSYLTQKTIKNNVSFSGVALHSGLDVNICIKPAEPNFGIVFKRVDFDEDETDLSMMANKINNGLNINEVQLVSKRIENKGFFEKFFQLFS